MGVGWGRELTGRLRLGERWGGVRRMVLVTLNGVIEGEPRGP